MPPRGSLLNQALNAVLEPDEEDRAAGLADVSQQIETKEEVQRMASSMNREMRGIEALNAQLNADAAAIRERTQPDLGGYEGLLGKGGAVDPAETDAVEQNLRQRGMMGVPLEETPAYTNPFDAAREHPDHTRSQEGNHIVYRDGAGRLLYRTREILPTPDHAVGAVSWDSDATPMSFVLDNLLGVDVRMMASAYMAATDDQKQSFEEVIEDLVRSFGASPGGGRKSILEGGNVAAGEIPFADVIWRKHYEKMQEDPKAKVGDIWPGPLGPMLLGAPGDTALSELTEDDYTRAGLAIEVAASPLTYLGGALGKGVGWLGKAAGTLSTARKAAKTAESTVKIGGDAAGSLLRVEKTALSQGVEQARQEKELVREIADSVGEGEARLIGETVEGAEHAHRADALAEMRDAAKANPRAVESLTTAEQQQLRKLDDLTDEDVAIMRVGKEEFARMLATDERAAKQLLGEQRRLLRTYGDVMANRYGLTEKLRIGGADIDLVRTADTGRLGAAAKRASNLLGRKLEEMQRLGILPKGMDAAGYFPHLVKGGRFNPLARRTMVPTRDFAEIKEAFRERRAMGDESELAKLFAGDDGLQRQFDRLDDARAYLSEAEYGGKRSDVIEEFESALANRRPSKEREDDFVTTMGAYLQAVNPVLDRARIGEIATGSVANVKGLVDDAGKAMVLSPADFVRRVAPEKLDTLFEARGGVLAPRKGGAVVDRVAEKGDSLTSAGGSAWSDEMANLLDDTGWHFLSKDEARGIPALQGKVVPKWLADEIKEVVGRLDPSSFDSVLFKWLAKTNKYWIPFVLGTPGFHARNFTFGEGQVYLALGARAFDPKVANDAHELASAWSTRSPVRGKLYGYSKPDVLDMMVKHGVFEGGLTSELERVLKSSAPYKGQWGKRAKQALLNPSSENWLGTRGFMRLANAPLARLSGGGGLKSPGRVARMEDVQRARVFLTELKRHGDPEKAAETVTKFLFDYTGASLSKGEKELRKVVPFYQWVRFSTQQAITAMFEVPGRYKNLDRLIDAIDATSAQERGDERFVPDHLRKRAAIRVPAPIERGLDELGEAIGRPREVGQRRAWALERPGAQLNHLGLADLAAQAGPLPKVVYETQLSPLATGDSGRYLFGGYPTSKGFNPDNESLSPLERTMSMHSEDMPGYALGLAGPYGGLARDVFLPPGTPRFPAEDQQQKLLMDLMSVLGGQRFSTYYPDLVRAERGREGAEVFEDREKRRVAEAKKPPSLIEHLLGMLFRSQGAQP